MMRSWAKPFLISFLPQLAVWLLYYFLGVDSSGTETTFQEIILSIYWPVLKAIEALMDVNTWWRLGFLVIIGPLIGAVVYSAAIAAAVRARRSAWRA